MTSQTRPILKGYFQRGLKPTQSNYEDLIDSFAVNSEVSALTDNLVAKSGSTMTGLLILSGNPEESLGAATKQYVDSSIASAAGAPFVDTLPLIKGNADATKKAKFSVTGVTPGQTRTITIPDSDGTMAYTSDVKTVATGGTGLTTLTLNNVILGNGTSAPKFVSPGSSGNILTSDGTIWTSAPPTNSGAFIYLGTFTGTTVSVLDITSVMSSTYDDYEIWIDNIACDSAGTSLYLRTSTDNGSSFSASASDYWYAYTTLTSTPAAINAGSTGAAQIVMGDTLSPTGQGAAGVIRIFGANSALYKRVTWTLNHRNNSAVEIGITGYGGRLAGTAINALRILLNTGTFSGTVRVYGIAKTGSGLSDSALTSTTLLVDTKTSSGDYTFDATYDIVEINKTVSEATTVNITMANLVVNRLYYVKDLKGDCDTYNITIVPDSGTINGETTNVISNPYACRGFYKTSGGNLSIVT